MAELASAFDVNPAHIGQEVQHTIAGFQSLDLIRSDESGRPVVDRGEAPDAPSARGVPPDGRFVGPFAVGASSFVVACEDAQLLAVLAARLADMRTRTSSAVPHRLTVRSELTRHGGHTWVVELDGLVTNMGADDDAVVQDVATSLVFGPLRHPSLTLHAAAVADDAGSVVVTGSPGRGKSTTLVQLLRAGFRYLADEVVTIDPATHVTSPCPMPISLTAREWRDLGVEVDPAGRFAGRYEPLAASSAGFALADSAPLKAIVIVSRGGEGPATLTPLPPAGVAYHLFPRMLHHNSLREEWLDDLVRLAEVVPGYWLSGDDLETLADLVAERVRA